MPFQITERSDGDTFDAGVYNGDRQEIVDFIESDIEDAILAAKQAIDPTVDAWDAAVGEPLGWANVKTFGALGDETADDTEAIQDAVDSLATTGGTVYFPSGVYKTTKEIRNYYDNVTFLGAGWDSTIRMYTGGTLNPVLGVITFGLNQSTVEVPITGGGVRHLHLDASDLCKPIYIRVTSLALFDDIFCENSIRSIFFNMKCHANTIRNCYLTDSNAPDEFGDGIYMEDCTDMKVLFNHIYDFTRIGIVSEGSSTKSTNPLIMGNHIQYGHDSTASEHNCGIWCENTNGARIIGNHVYDMYNGSPAQQVHGITIWAGQDAECTFQITDNVIRGVYSGSTTPYGLGMSIATHPSYSNVIITGNEILGPYVYGIYIASAKSIHVENNYFGNTTFLVSGACISVNADGTTCGPMYIGPNQKGTMTYTAVGASDFNLFDDGSGITSVTLQGLKDWRVAISTTPDLMYIHDCDLTVDSDNSSSFGIGAARLEVTDSRITNTAATIGTLTSIRVQAGSLFLFNNVVMDNLLMQVGASVITAIHFNNCFFSDCQMTTNANAAVFFRSCNISGYPSDGFLRGATGPGTLNIFIWDCIIDAAGDYTPFVKTTTDADVFCAYNCLRGSGITNLTSFTPAVTGYTLTAATP